MNKEVKQHFLQFGKSDFVYIAVGRVAYWSTIHGYASVKSGRTDTI